MEKGQILIARRNRDSRLTKGQEYRFVGHHNQDSKKVFVIDDTGQESCYDLQEYFDLPPSIEFKKGDRVWHIGHGWGDIEDIDTFIAVRFSAGRVLFPLNTKELFFKPQQLDYSRPHPKEGEWCWFWDGFGGYCNLRKFAKTIVDEDGERYRDVHGNDYDYCAPCPVECLPPHLKGGSK